jgi:hypothetical protein
MKSIGWKPVDACAAFIDSGQRDLLVSDLVRTHALQVWFISGHLVNMPLVYAGKCTAPGHKLWDHHAAQPASWLCLVHRENEAFALRPHGT